MNRTVASTFQENGQFALAVPNPFISGEYTCKISNSSSVTLCIPNDSRSRRAATVPVDGVKGRLALMDSEIQIMRNKEAEMAGQIQTLQANNSVMAGEIQTLQASNSVMAGAVSYTHLTLPTRLSV